MADITIFPNITTPLVAGDNIKSLRAGATIKPGQVVEISDSRTVVPATGTGTPIGVAIGNAVLGEQVAVAGNGCWVIVVNADSATNISAGTALEADDNTIGGTVSALASGKRVAIAIDDIAGGGMGVAEIAL
ncbi:MAG TPA: DUF2190 family protein [Methanomassiliicoccaceae archaeon]|nr:DUF2190 family protein [Methanomassiliicoccaceae archaeon]